MSVEAPRGPRGYPLVGILPEIWRDPLRFFERVAAEYGGVAKVGTGRFTFYLLSDPEGIRHVLQDNAKNYWKGKGLAAARPVMGDGLATSHGELWRRQRRSMQPAFSRARIDELVPLVNRTLDSLLESWERAARSGEVRDVVQDLSGMVRSVVMHCLLGSDVDSLDAAAFAAALEEANTFIHHAAFSMVPIPERVPTPRRVRFARALGVLDRMVHSLIAERRRRGASGDDLLARMLSARDPETGATMSDAQLRDEIMTMFVAGHDTTTAALGWAFHVLGGEPEARERIEAELAGLGDSAPAAAELAGLDYTGRAVQEVMRLYPPSWVIVRTPIADDDIAGYRIPKDAPLLISQWVVHRSPALWPEPERFDPDRFLPGRRAGQPRHAYLPYGGGARTCIGSALADMIVRLSLARVMRRFRLEPVPGATVRPWPRTTLQPRPGVRMRLRPVR